MEHSEYIKAIQKQQSFVRMLFGKRKNISKKIDNITKERYKDVVGKYFHVTPECSESFQGIETGYYFVRNVRVYSNFIGSDKVEICLTLSTYGMTGFDDEITGVDIINKNLFFPPSEDYVGLIEKCVVSENEAMKPLYETIDKIIEYYHKTE